MIATREAEYYESILVNILLFLNDRLKFVNAVLCSEALSEFILLSVSLE